jgi:hypothetical protein
MFFSCGTTKVLWGALGSFLRLQLALENFGKVWYGFMPFYLG